MAAASYGGRGQWHQIMVQSRKSTFQPFITTELHIHSGADCPTGPLPDTCVPSSPTLQAERRRQHQHTLRYVGSTSTGHTPSLHLTVALGNRFCALCGTGA